VIGTNNLSTRLQVNIKKSNQPIICYLSPVTPIHFALDY